MDKKQIRELAQQRRAEARQEIEDNDSHAEVIAIAIIDAAEMIALSLDDIAEALVR